MSERVVDLMAALEASLAKAKEARRKCVCEASEGQWFVSERDCPIHGQEVPNE